MVGSVAITGGIGDFYDIWYACLWQAYPWLTNQELLEILKKSANRYDVPELPYGCGIVDIQKAIDLIEAMQEE
ncbi:hypothetical protein K6V21_03985 [Bacteroides cellulosilyticus]|uniref:hypothetical protein n=1 Tax=Bacteroides cellulosilyticus TaxID=246787 RepID=UPI001CC980ED|nr:hypothetical protein [Bacteroides cellulosilyticus]UBD70595.1 hypothetical protein K6V21_03985 [Bacteroides cellulosilyticus]